MRGGYLQSGGGDECPSFGHLAGHGRERERGVLMRELVEVCGSEWKLEFWNCWNFGKWNSCGLWRKEEKKGKRKKEKKLIKRRYSL